MWPHGRPTLGYVIKTEEVTGDALARFVRGQRSVKGERRHVAWNLRGKSFKELPGGDFAFGPIRKLAEDDPKPAGTKSARPSECLADAWKRIHSDPVRRELVRHEEREIQAGAWCKDQTIVTYHGTA